MAIMDHLRAIISSDGPISFRDFMEIALYDPCHGYYCRGTRPFGRDGDFITSPHTHCLFGALHARQIEEFWEVLGEPSCFRVVEMGAGAGYWADDILSYLKDRRLFDGLRYVIVEPFEANRRVQRGRLGRFGGRVEWVGGLRGLVPGPGCVISNELVDAFPVHVVEKAGACYFELYVGLAQGGLELCLGPLSRQTLACYVEELPKSLPDGYRTEINLGVRDWLRDISEVLDVGFVVTVDYGYTWREYFHSNRSRGTLLAYHAQRASEDVLARPGCQDITAHVNFSDIERYGRELGLVTLGYTPQWAFLAGLGVEETLKEIGGGGFEPFSPQLAAVKMLLLPQGMGESHKVMVQGKGVAGDIGLKGLALRNLRSRLGER